MRDVLAFATSDFASKVIVELSKAFENKKCCNTCQSQYCTCSNPLLQAFRHYSPIHGNIGYSLLSSSSNLIELLRQQSSQLTQDRTLAHLCPIPLLAISRPERPYLINLDLYHLHRWSGSMLAGPPGITIASHGGASYLPRRLHRFISSCTNSDAYAFTMQRVKRLTVQ